MHGVWLDKGQQPAHSFACRKRNAKKEPTGLETRKTRIFTRRPEADVAGGAASSAPPPRAPSARPLAALALEHPAHSCVPPEPARGPVLSCLSHSQHAVETVRTGNERAGLAHCIIAREQGFSSRTRFCRFEVRWRAALE